MIKYFTSILFLQFLFFGVLKSQEIKPELLNVVPESPNAASLAKFGQIPVSFYTGLPQISFPLFDISSGKLKVPVTLSYHASGVRVEEVASWVGLNFALSTGGVITREIRGATDEGLNGYFHSLFSASALANNSGMGDLNSPQNDFLRDVARGRGDVQADIFSFSMGDISGKFVYNQEDGTFYTIPRQNIKIEAIDEGRTAFKLTTPSGDIYNFSVLEYTTAAPLCIPAGSGSSPNISAWYLSEVISSDKKDSVRYEYAANNYSYETLGYEERNFLTETRSMGGVYQTLVPPKKNVYCTQMINVREKILQSIKFKNGSLVFNLTTNRFDLPNSRALDNIELRNMDGVTLRKWKFDYSYFRPLGMLPTSYEYPQALTLRLKLDSLKETALSGGLVMSKKPYVFEYKNIHAIPNRMSKAQDYWGFYNGKNINTTLIPSAVMQTANANVPIYFNGGDRNVDTAFTGAGSIKRISYPTGGYTDYVFENNKIKDSTLTTARSFRQIVLDVNGTSIGNSRFEKQFSVNEPKSELNNENPAGGAFVTLQFGDAGCEINAGATTCAQFILKGVTDPNFSSGLILAGTTIFCPNGEYKLTASFNQNPANFSEFYFTASWPYQISTFSPERFTGGLRVKMIKDYDGINHENDIVRNFKYLKDDNSLLSSGSINGYPLINTFKRTRYERQYWGNTDPANGLPVTGYYLKFYDILFSYSNQSLTPTAGSYTTYDFVTASTGENEEIGKTTYKFLQRQDIISNIYPFVSFKNDWQRGQLLEQVEYRKSASEYFPVKRIRNFYSTSLIEPKSSISLKTYMIGESNSIGSTFYETPRFEEYTDESNWIGLVKTVTQTYDNVDTTKSVLSIDDYSYSPLHFSLISKSTANSNGYTNIKTYKYPQDFAGITANAKLSNSIKYLQNNHVMSTPIEIVDKVLSPAGNLTIRSAQFNSFKENNPVPDTIWIANPTVKDASFNASTVRNGLVVKDRLYSPEISYDQYDKFNNIIQQSIIDGTKTSYTWGYQGAYPIAEVKNANVNEFFYEGFENIGVTGMAHTGLKYWSGNYTIGFTIPNTRSYKYNYWFLQGDKWIYSGELDYATGKVINGVSGIDDVRVYPEDAEMTSYTYDPHIGMTSATDARANTTYYDYDAFQRLLNIRNDKGEIIKNYNYNYANIKVDYVNDEMSRSFTRNNCAAGGTPGSVIYIVPRGTYTSSISLAAANQQANADIDANGQAYANANSSCTFYNSVLTQTFTKNNCEGAATGSSYVYTVPAGTYSSLISLADANAKAQQDLLVNGQVLANTNGTCACTGTMNRMINGVCETANKVVTKSVYNAATRSYTCTFYYIWSNGVRSGNFSEQSLTECAVDQ